MSVTLTLTCSNGNVAYDSTDSRCANLMLYTDKKNESRHDMISAPSFSLQEKNNSSTF